MRLTQSILKRKLPFVGKPLLYKPRGLFLEFYSIWKENYAGNVRFDLKNKVTSIKIN